jgi:FtsZ-interacting cell division protein YlmF
VLIWPALVCALAFGFRSTIRSLLRVRLTQIDAAGFSAKFEDAAHDAEQLVRSDDPQRPTRPTKELNRDDIAFFTPQTYTDARPIGEAFREGKPCVIDLTQLNDPEGRRLVDFTAGLVFMGRGSIDRIRSKVFALTPAPYLHAENAGHRKNREPSAPT